MKFVSLDNLSYFWTKAKAFIANGYVAKISGKGLSTNDYTTEEKTKLAGIEANANDYSLPIASDETLGGMKVGDGLSIDGNGVLSADQQLTVDSLLSSTSTNPVQNKVIKAALDGKQASLTTEQLAAVNSGIDEDGVAKLNDIEDGAQVNVIETLKLNGTALTPEGKAVNLDLSNYATKSDITAVLKYKGSVANYAALPTSGQVQGDVYNVEAADPTHGIKAGDNVAWTGTAWDVLAGTVDLSNYVEKEDGKGLSSNDYTTTEKTKLAGIAAGAQVNVLETLKLNGTALTPTDKAVNIEIAALTEEEIDTIFAD